ncbi:OmpA family protein [Clostridium magnum]|uniref:Outer membrane protein A n=1 Tax=Clostridium magnum DSM 2767 TaxID=1121326 RepID=A0A162QJI7_9CLOT|nr:OmpA family protein [Clostridium magnum]KZL88603.1 outer membrane protein A precursor [Clostridium magnum DSM 2767]SHI84465.1 Outer membrane protein OmpA [Clostridium magnum DSM 2767]
MFTKYNRLIGTSKEDGNIWRTFTDLLSTILLFVLLFLVFSNIIKQGEIDLTKHRVEQIIGLRESIIEDMRKSFKNAGLNIDIDKKTGDIIFSSDVLFEFNKSEIKPEFKDSLNKFIPQYVKVLLSPKYCDSVSEIVIEGHTDDVGDYNYNMDLSQKRANSIVNYILSNEFKDLDDSNKDILKTLITANGKSNSRLIKNADGTVNSDKSRRVLFKFRLKDEESIKELGEILKR